MTYTKDPEIVAADKQLEDIFLELINIQSTYCVGKNMDPIVMSYNNLIKGIRTFNEIFGVEKFANDFLEQSAKHDVKCILNLLDKYNV